MSGKQIIHSPLRRVAHSNTQGLRQCRNFTSSQSNRAAAVGQNTARGMIARQMGKEKTMQSRISKAKGNDIPTDLGFFPETLIKPERKDLPSLISSKFGRRLRIEWTAFWQKTRDFGGAIFQMKWAVKKDPITRKRRREPMYLSERYWIARELHRALYMALARGDRSKISTIACTGLQNALKTRLDHRRSVNGPEESWSIAYTGWTPDAGRWPWILQALVPPMFKSTRIVADRMGQIPIGKDGRLRQVTVKIRSVQTLDKNDGTGPKSKYVEEYVVIQQMKIDGKEDEWMIWGTTQPSTEKQIDDLFSKQKEEPSFMDRFKSEMKM